jgi:hypothetical protein
MRILPGQERQRQIGLSRGEQGRILIAGTRAALDRHGGEVTRHAGFAIDRRIRNRYTRRVLVLGTITW